MNRTAWHAEFGTANRFYRDRENGWMFGVCAGIAEYANFNLLAVRVVAVACLVFFSIPTALAYIAATLLVRDKPLIYSGGAHESEFWRCRREDGRG